jgi:hypothetical protein
MAIRQQRQKQTRFAGKVNKQKTKKQKNKQRQIKASTPFVFGGFLEGRVGVLVLVWAHHLWRISLEQSCEHGL